MTQTDLPLPAELAVDTEPLSEPELERMAELALQVADEAGLDVAEAVDGYVVSGPAQATEPAGRWAITDEGSAEWAMRKLAAAHVEVHQLGEQATEWSRRITEWFMQRARPLQARGRFFEAHLERYAMERRAADPKAKTLTLPSGQVRTRATAPRVTITDEGSLLSWLRSEQGQVVPAEVVEVVEKVRVSELRDHVTAVQLVVELAASTEPCGCTYQVHPSAMPMPVALAAELVGVPTVCMACGAPGTVSGVSVLATTWQVQDGAGNRVPGCDVDAGGVSAKAVPSV